MRVPSDWTEVEEEAWQFEGQNVSTYVAASPDVNDLIALGTGDTFASTTLKAPKAFFGASDEPTLLSVRPVYSNPMTGGLSADCVGKDELDCADSNGAGTTYAFRNGGGTATSTVVLTAESRDDSHTVLVYLQFVGQSGDGIVRRLVLNTFDAAEDEL